MIGYNLQTFAKRGDGSSNSRTRDSERWERQNQETIDRLNRKLNGDLSDGTVESFDSHNWEFTKDVKQFSTILQDLASYGTGDESVYYVNYKGVGWVRIDNESETGNLRTNTSNIVGAIEDGGWGTGFYGNTRGTYAYNRMDASDHARGYADSYDFEFSNGQYAGHLTSEGRLRRFATESEMERGTVSFRGRQYPINYGQTRTRNGSVRQYGTVDLDVSDVIVKKGKR